MDVWLIELLGAIVCTFFIFLYFFIRTGGISIKDGEKTKEVLSLLLLFVIVTAVLWLLIHLSLRFGIIGAIIIIGAPLAILSMIL